MVTVYNAQEIEALSDLAKEYNLYLHMDGARLANAAVHLSMGFREFTADAGVDILSFGGTKNGMLFGESVLFFQPGISDDFKYLRKQSMQLASKMRFISAQFESYLSNKVWYINAQHANKMAQLLLKKVSVLPKVKITQKVEANAVFAIIPHEVIEPLQKKFFFYVWDENRDEVRWMTSFDTTPEDIDGFAEHLALLLS